MPVHEVRIPQRGEHPGLQPLPREQAQRLQQVRLVITHAYSRRTEQLVIDITGRQCVVQPVVIAVGKHAPLHTDYIGIIQRLSDPLALTDVLAQRLGFQEQQRRILQQQGVIHRVVARVLAVLAVDVLDIVDIPPQCGQHRFDQHGLGVLLAGPAAFGIKPADNLARLVHCGDQPFSTIPCHYTTPGDIACQKSSGIITFMANGDIVPPARDVPGSPALPATAARRDELGLRRRSSNNCTA